MEGPVPQQDSSTSTQCSSQHRSKRPLLVTPSHIPAVCELCSSSTTIHDRVFEDLLRLSVSYIGLLTDTGGEFDSIVYRHVPLIRRLLLSFSRVVSGACPLLCTKR